MWRHALLLAISTLAGMDAAIAQSQTLGRLFYTPEQRAALNANIRSIVEAPRKPTPIPPAVTLSGVVTRSDGERTVWIDGRAYYQSNPAGITVITNSGNPAGAELKVQGVIQRMPVRVGQRLDPSSGHTAESYEMLGPSGRENRPPMTPDSGAESASSPSE